MEHTYYIPKHKKVYGTLKDNKDIVALLYALYMRYENGHVGKCDSVSLCNGKNQYIEINNRIRLVRGCDGKGTGEIIWIMEDNPNYLKHRFPILLSEHENNAPFSMGEKVIAYGKYSGKIIICKKDAAYVTLFQPKEKEPLTIWPWVGLVNIKYLRKVV